MNILVKLKNKLLHYIKPTPKAPGMDIKRELMNVVRTKYHPGIFVETGTLMGDTVEYFKHSFKKLYSIELAEDLAVKARARFAPDDHISIINGDSGIVLRTLVTKFTEPALFWLDGHYSSEFFVGDEYIKTARGEKDTPVEEELKVILGCGVDHIILIDDARLFVGMNDYPTITQLKRLVKKYSGKYIVSVKNDIIYILPNEIVR